MGRTALRAALVAAVEDIVGSGVHVEAFNGDPRVIDRSGIYVKYLEGNFSEPKTLSGNTYRRRYLYEIFVTTEFDGTTQSGDRALDLLDQLENLYGKRLIPGVGTLRLDNHPAYGVHETIVLTQHGKSGYVQCWAIPDVTTNT